MVDTSNINNYFANGKSVWLDGAVLTSHPKFSRPSMGFHILRIHPTKDGYTTFNSFAAEYIGDTTRSYGGQRIAEYVLFTNTTETGVSSMTTNEAAMINRYLRVKWFPQTIASVTVEEGASLDVDKSANLTISQFADNGAADLSLASGTYSVGTLVNVGAIAHLDASATNTMTIETVNGTNFVTRWDDVDGGSYFAIHENTTGAAGQRTNPENRKPFLNPVLTQNGLPIIDLGSAIYAGNTNGHGASFVFSGFPELKVAEYLSVISDTEDLQTRLSGQYGPSYTSYRTGKSSGGFGGYNYGRRGKTVSGKNPPLFYEVANSGNKACLNGTNLVNNAVVSWNYNPPDGFNIINIRPTTAISCNLIGRQVRYTGSNKVDSYGGQRIAEYMIFANLLTEEKRQRIYNAFRTKWYGDPISVTNFYNNLSLAEQASMSVKWDALVVTNRLTLAGSLAAPVAHVANMDVTGPNATVSAPLTIPDGATLSFSRGADGSWTSLSVSSLEAEGAVTVSLSAEGWRRIGGTSALLVAADTPISSIENWSIVGVPESAGASLVLRDGCVWVYFADQGMFILVK